MKTTVLTFAALLISIGLTLAQTNAGFFQDHTYSTHNYKHPNKAAAALKQERKTAIVVNLPTNQPTLTNYKQAIPGAVQAGGVVIGITGPSISRSYKATHHLYYSTKPVVKDNRLAQKNDSLSVENEMKN
jgi:hypothetical protein